MTTQRTAAEIQADIDALDREYDAARTGLITAPSSTQHYEWRRTVNLYRGRKANLVAELRSANGRAKG